MTMPTDEAHTLGGKISETLAFKWILSQRVLLAQNRQTPSGTSPGSSKTDGQGLPDERVS